MMDGLNRPLVASVVAMALVVAPFGAAAQEQKAPVFNSEILEITSPVLDRLVRALAAEDVERKKLSATVEAQDACLEALEDDARYRALVRRAEAGEIDWDEVEKYQIERCGEPSWILEERLEARIGESAGFTARQYAILKERVLPFCVDPGNTYEYVYTAAEGQAMRPRCQQLLALLNDL